MHRPETRPNQLAPGSPLSLLLQDLANAGGKIEVGEWDFNDEVRQGVKLGLLYDTLPPGWGITKNIHLTDEGYALMGISRVRKIDWMHVISLIGIGAFAVAWLVGEWMSRQG